MGDNKASASLNKCRLCLSAEANHKKSHLITRWLFKKVSGTEGGAKIYSITVLDGKGIPNKKPHQDILFEQFILCQECEHYLGFVERYIKNTFYIPFRTAEVFKNQEEFRTVTFNSDTITYCERVNEVIFTLFTLCQLWRATLSQQLHFKRLKCRIETIERLRETLLSFKSSTQTELFEKTQQKRVRGFKYLIMILNNDTKISPLGTLTQICSTADEQIHWIEVNDLKFYFTDNNYLRLYRNDIATNTGEDKVKVLHISDLIWNELNTDFLQKIAGMEKAKTTG